MKLETRAFLSERWDDPIPAALDSEQTLAIVFGSPGFADRRQPFEAIREALPRSTLVGCSTAGEIFGTRVFDDSLALAVVRFERTQVRSAAFPVASASGSFDAGARIGAALAAPDLRAVTLLSEGLAVNGSELARGINSVLPDSVVVTGGLAGDGPRFQRTWVLDGGVPRLNIVSAVGLYGDSVRVGHGSKGGWDLFGPERSITRSEGNVLFELDGKPALELYKEYLGERASGLPATALLFPLEIRESRDAKSSLVRTVLSVSEEAQSMTFAGDLPQGWLAQLMRANFDRLVEGASEAARLGGAEMSGPCLSIAISCVGRRLVLGQRSEEETEAILDVLPAGTQQIGFYSYGELSPYGVGKCELHNQTMTLTTISEG